jgi:hypothetical protein
VVVEQATPVLAEEAIRIKPAKTIARHRKIVEAKLRRRRAADRLK